MKLRTICQQLKRAQATSTTTTVAGGPGNGTATATGNGDDNRHDITLSLSSCSDGDKEMSNFIRRLEKGAREGTHVTKMILRTDFFMNLTQANVLLFLQTVIGKIMKRQLEELIIESSSRFHIDIIPPEGLLALRNLTKLRKLVLENVQVTASHKPFLASLSVTLQNHPSLQELIMVNFFANDFSNTNPYILDPLLQSITSIPNLSFLDLSGCGSHALSGQAVQLLSTDALSSLFRHESLTDLSLSFLELNDDHFEAISKQLQNNHNNNDSNRKKSVLTNLNLDYHKLDRYGFQKIMEALQTNSTLKSLSLRSLRDKIVDADGFRHVMKMLQCNYTIQSLFVTTDPYKQAKMDLYLRMNIAGRALLRGRQEQQQQQQQQRRLSEEQEPHQATTTTTMNQWMDILAEHSHDIDVTRHFIQEIPGLFSFVGDDNRNQHTTATVTRTTNTTTVNIISPSPAA